MSDKDPEQLKEDKKNTDLWKQKQEEKKRKKEVETQAEGQTAKTDKKQKKKKQKEEKKDEEKKPDKKEEAKFTKKEEKIEHPRKQSEQKQVEQPQPPKEADPVYHKLIKLDSLIDTKDKSSRVYQEQLITKYMEQCLSDSDIVLYVGEQSRITKHQQVYVQGLNKCSQAELVCRFSDLSYFLEGSVSKIFIEAELIFSNGSILAKEGALNVALMGSFYNIPLVIVGGSWAYNGWGPTNYQALEERYGPQTLKKLNWIEDRYIRSAVTEVGVINPRQVSIYPPLIYKQLNLGVQW